MMAMRALEEQQQQEEDHVRRPWTVTTQPRGVAVDGAHTHRRVLGKHCHVQRLHTPICATQITSH